MSALALWLALRSSPTGANSGIGPDSIAAWLRALGRDEPFVLTGIGFDWVAFRPDIMDQGTETVAGVADGLRQSLHPYC